VHVLFMLFTGIWQGRHYVGACLIYVIYRYLTRKTLHGCMSCLCYLPVFDKEDITWVHVLFMLFTGIWQGRHYVGACLIYVIYRYLTRKTLRGCMSYLCYLYLFACSGVRHISCCVFVCFSLSCQLSMLSVSRCPFLIIPSVFFGVMVFFLKKYSDSQCCWK
jgi:sugar phosphate permease